MHTFLENIDVWTSQFCHVYDHDEMQIMESRLNWIQFHKNEQLVAFNGWCCALQDQSLTTKLINSHAQKHTCDCGKQKECAHKDNKTF